MRRYCYLIILTLATLWAAALHGQPLARASVQPDTVALGQTARYTVMLRGVRELTSLTPPAAPGIKMSDGISKQQIYSQITNGQMTAVAALTWEFEATETGYLTIPAWSFESSDGKVEVPAASFTVVEEDNLLKNLFTLKLELPPGPVYVGQTIPAKLVLSYAQSLQIGAGGEIEFGSESMLELGTRAEEGRGTQRQGETTYVTVSWRTHLTAFKAGEAKVRFSLPIVYADPRWPGYEVSRHRLTTGAVSVNVLPLPETSRPESFTGGVGTFDLQARLDREEVPAGEPVVLTVEVTGQGSFDRLAAPELSSAPGWRVYPPKVDFTPGDDAHFTGTKRFDYLLVPDVAGTQSVPALSLSTFDPARGQYVEKTFEARDVEVTPAPGGGPVGNVPPRTEKATDPFAPLIHVEGWSAPSPPPWRSAGYLAANGSAILAGVGLFAWRSGVGRKRVSQPTGRQRAEEAWEQARQAARAGDTGGFLTIAWRALQLAAATREPPVERPEALATQEVEERLSATMGAPEQAELRSLLEALQAASFGGLTSGNVESASQNLDVVMAAALGER